MCTRRWGGRLVVLAITAIVVSIETLRRNAAQFQRQRLDAREDKLRTEIADLIAVITAEVSHKIDIAVEQATKLRELDRDAQEADAVNALLAFVTGANAIFGREVSGTYQRRINAHAYKIMMTTSIDAIIQPVTSNL